MNSDFCFTHNLDLTKEENKFFFGGCKECVYAKYQYKELKRKRLAELENRIYKDFTGLAPRTPIYELVNYGDECIGYVHYPKIVLNRKEEK